MTITLEQAAADLGLTTEQLRRMLARWDETDAQLIDACIAAHPSGKAVPR